MCCSTYWLHCYTNPNIRVPLSLLARLDRSVDHQEVTTGRSINRAIVMKNALRTFLDKQGY